MGYLFYAAQIVISLSMCVGWACLIYTMEIGIWGNAYVWSA